MSRPDDPTDHDAVDDEEALRKERIDIQRKVSLKFKEFRGFITEFSENISTGGMFIRTTRPQPPGSIFDFEFTLGEDYTLIHGLGEVVWVREKDEGFDRPAGMGVRFLSLDPDSRRLIDEIVARRLESEGGSEGADVLSGWGMGASDQPEPTAGAEAPAAEQGGLFAPLQAPPAPRGSESAEASFATPDEAPFEPHFEAGNPATPSESAPGPDASDDRESEELSDLSDLVGDERRPVSPADAGEPYVSSTVSPYARSYRSYQSHRGGAAGRSRRLSDLLSWRPLGIVLIVVVVLAVLGAGFFLFAPDAAMELLMGSSGGGDETATAAAASERTGETPSTREAPATSEAAGVEAAVTVTGDAPPSGEAEPAAEPGAPAGAVGSPDRAEAGSTGAGTAGPADQTARRTPAPATAAPSEPLPQEPGGEPFTRILNITYEPRGDQLVVTIHLDGVIREWNYSLTRINAPPPRELVRIRGAREPFPRTTIPVAADLVDRIRTGFHPRDGENEIHVVLDLASPDVVLERSEASGDEIRLYLGRSEDQATDQPTNEAPGA